MTAPRWTKIGLLPPLCGGLLWCVGCGEVPLGETTASPATPDQPAVYATTEAPVTVDAGLRDFLDQRNRDLAGHAVARSSGRTMVSLAPTESATDDQSALQLFSPDKTRSPAEASKSPGPASTDATPPAAQSVILPGPAELSPTPDLTKKGLSRESNYPRIAWGNPRAAEKTLASTTMSDEAASGASLGPTLTELPDKTSSLADPTGRFAAAFATQPRAELSGVGTAEEQKLAIPSVPRPELQSAVLTAQGHLRRGAQLAERGAYYSAQQEFLTALTITAGALDAQQRTDAHQRALRAGLLALDEARDLAPGETLPTGLADTCAGHQTKLLPATELAAIPRAQLWQMYLDFAQTQLGLAGGDLLPAADALFGLGKVQLLQQATLPTPSAANIAKATVYFRTALVIEPRHAMAANELGVLLARQGNLAQAKRALQTSASITAHPLTWKNLALVHKSLGETQLAQLAERESKISAARWRQYPDQANQLANGGVRVVDQQTFARAAPLNYDVNTQPYPTTVIANQPGQPAFSRTTPAPRGPVPQANAGWGTNAIKR
ncbi:MAG: hypothetical protein SFX18_01275 [Pirellulales bacterium]|nr:hypothetical protein [Pirellulales bacterium]